MSVRAPSKTILGLPDVVWLSIVVVAAVSWQYWATLSFGFVYDDYHFVRPYSIAEVLRSFHGSWDQLNVERPFYRPLTVLLYAGRFEAFGLNASAYHLLSLVMFAAAGLLAALLARRITGCLSTGLWVAFFWAVHPNAPLSMGAWITNQMHLLQLLLMLLAFTWWWHVRTDARWTRWTPLLALGLAAFLVKEDGIVLLPAIVGAHELYRWIEGGSVPHVPKPFLAAAVCLPVALLLLRHVVLGGVGGYGFAVTQDSAIANLWKGPAQTLLLRPVHSLATGYQAWGMSLAIAIALVLGWRRGEPRALFLMLLGIVLVVAFDAPFVFITKREQYYALTAGAVLTFAASADLLTRRAPGKAKPALVLAFALMLAAMSQRAADARDLYAPRSETTLGTDRIVREWASVPVEIRDWLERKASGARTSTLSADVPIVVFGAYDRERDARGQTFRWTSERVRIYPAVGVARLSFTLRATGTENPSRPFNVVVRQSHREIAKVRLERGQEQRFEVNLPHRFLIPAFAEIELDHTWTPGPRDPRHLGVVLADVSPVDSRGALVQAGYQP